MIDESDGHALIVGPTGTGKGRSIAIPNLLQWDGPAVVIDVKGELSAVAAAQRRRMGQRVLRFDPWRLGVGEPSRFNPLAILAQAGDDIADRAYMLAAMLRHPSSNPREPFWEERGETLIAGLLVLTATLPGETDRSFGRVWEHLNGDDPVYALAAILDKHEDIHPFARKTIGAFLSTVEVTRSGILSTAQSAMRVFASDAVKRATGGMDFDLAEVTSGAPLSIFLTIPPTRLGSHSALLRIWLAALLTALTERRVRPEKPTLLVLDEMAQLGEMEQIRAAVTLARGYGVRAMLFLQSYAQLKLLYRDHRSLLENCASIVTFGHTSRSMSVEIAEALGDISADALYGMAPNEAAVKTAGCETRIARRLDYLKDAMFRDCASPNPMFSGSRS